jgi:hypothetical protein
LRLTLNRALLMMLDAMTFSAPAFAGQKRIVSLPAASPTFVIYVKRSIPL